MKHNQEPAVTSFVDAVKAEYDNHPIRTPLVAGAVAVIAINLASNSVEYVQSELSENRSEVAAEKAMEALEVSDIYDFELMDAAVEAKPHLATDLSTGEEAAYTVIDVTVQRDETPEFAAAKAGQLEGLEARFANYPDDDLQPANLADEIHEVQWREGMMKKSTMDGQRLFNTDVLFIESDDDEGTHRIAINANKLQEGAVNVEMSYVFDLIFHGDGEEFKEREEPSIQKIGDVTVNIEDGKVTDVAVDPAGQ